MRRRTAIPAILSAPWALAQQKTLPVSMIPVTGQGNKYWPRWRGPSGQGLVEGSGYPDTWSDDENVLWKADLPGAGNSSPIVWGDRIFLTTARDSARRSILCLSRRNGELIWEAFAPDAAPEHVNRKNGLASSTPATDGERVYVFLGNQGLMAVDLNGSVVWTRGLGPTGNYHGPVCSPLLTSFRASTPATDGERVYVFLGNQGLMAVDLNGSVVWTRGLGPTGNYHGPVCSPLLYKEMVILYLDQRRTKRDGKPTPGFVAAFDRKSGETVWWTERQETVGWGTPVAIRAGDRDEIIVHGQYRVYSYDPATGKELWSCGGPTSEVIPTPVAGQVIPTPVAGHGLLFCSSGRAGPTLAIRPGGSGDVTDTHVAWRTSRGSPFIPSPLLYGDYLYTVNDMVSVATCFEARTGKTMWQQRLGRVMRESFSVSPVAVEGKIFLTNDAGETFVLKAGPEFQLLHVNRLSDQTLASPALVDGRWYIRTSRQLLAIGV